MAFPDPTQVAPWYLRNITQALQLDETTGNVFVRTGITGNITITGPVTIPGTVTVNSSAADPVHVHLDEIGTSGILTVPYMPIGNTNVAVTGGNVTVSGNVNAVVSGTVAVSGNISGITSNITVNPITGVVSITGNANVSGNVGILGNVNVNPITGNVGIVGNVNANVSGNVGIIGNVNATVSGNVGIVGNVNANVSGNVGVTSLGNVVLAGNTLPVSGNVGIVGNVNANVSGNVGIIGNVNVTQGTSPWVVSGNVGISGTANVVLADDASVVISGFSGAVSDAFGRLRVSEPFTLFDTNSRYYDHGQFSNVNVGTANVVYVQNQSSFQLNVGSATGDSVIRETKKVFPYQPGKSQLTLLTFCMNTPKTNLRQRVGLFGANDGVFFENDGTFNYMVIRSGSTGVEERVRQDAWNGDQLTGSSGANNPSGITLFPNRTQIYYADVEWLGVGSVRVGFIINGVYILCHTFNHANQSGNTRVYMTTATLPIRYEITNAGATASASQMTQICSTVISEGGYNNFGTTQSAGTGTTQVRLVNANTYYPIVSIRLAPTRLDSIVFPRQVDVLSPTVNYYRWILLLNATLTGATFANTSPTGTVQYDLAATAISGGIELQSGYASARELTQLSSIDFFQFQLGRTLAGVSDVVTLALAATSNNADVLAELGWQELT
jgi:hypothetical protein